MNLNQQKQCKGCKKMKPSDDFHKLIIRRDYSCESDNDGFSTNIKPVMNCESCRTKIRTETKEFRKSKLTGQKKCHKCHAFKDLSEYKTNRKNLSRNCSVCRKILNARCKQNNKDRNTVFIVCN